MAKQKSELKNYPLAKSRFELIKEYVKDKKVLDCGCVTHKVHDKEWRKKWWLHDLIVKESKSCLGVDIEKLEIDKLKEEGYNLVCANVEKMELNEKFDCIVAGELIEHLSNPGLFLERVKAHLENDGIVIITTPNPFSIGLISRVALGLKYDVNYQHTCFFDTITIKQLFQRHGFIIKNYYWCPSIYPKAKSNIILKFRRDLAPTIVIIAMLAH